MKALVDGDGEELIGRLLRDPAVQVVKHNHYRQYDTYFLFDDDDQAACATARRFHWRVRRDGSAHAADVTIPTRRASSTRQCCSHSRFIARRPPLRFYREYFKAHRECEVHQDRLRGHVLYKGVLFYVNLDHIMEPKTDRRYVEIKSRTWSARDAEYKAALTAEILDEVLGIQPDERVRMEYVDLC